MTDYQKAFRSEVKWLLSGLKFIAGHGRFLSGRLAAVEFTPVSQGTEILGFRIVPIGISPSVPETTLEEGKKVLQLQMDNVSGQEKAIIGSLLNQLSLPRPEKGDLANWGITVRSVVGDHVSYIPVFTNERGYAIFYGVPTQSVCEVTYVNEPVVVN